MEIKNLTNAELRAHHEKMKASRMMDDMFKCESEIISRFMNQTEVPIKELLEKAWINGSHWNSYKPDGKPLLPTFDQFYSENQHLVPVAEVPDLSEMWNDAEADKTRALQNENFADSREFAGIQMGLEHLKTIGVITLTHISK